MVGFYGLVRSIFVSPGPTTPLQNSLLTWSAGLFLFAFYSLVPLAVLLDMYRVPSHETSRGSGRNIASFSLTVLVIMACSVALFPLALARNWHPALVAVGAACGLLALLGGAPAAIDPGPLSAFSRSEGLTLLAVIVLAIAAVWTGADSLPPGMNGDEAKVGLMARSLLAQGNHPFFFSDVGIPGTMPFTHGLFGAIYRAVGGEDPVQVVRFFPRVAAVLCVPVLYAWMRLLGTPLLAATASAVFATLPAFGYYSRVPCGASLLLAALLFLWGMTRGFVGPGWLGPVIGGLGLGVAQWDFPASRALGLIAIAAPIVTLLFPGRTAKGWLWRHLGLLTVAAPVVLGFVLIQGFDPDRFTWFLTLKGYNTSSSLALHGHFLRMSKELFGLWFSPNAGAASWLTVPGSAYLTPVFAALCLLGLGIAMTRPGGFAAPLLLVALVGGNLPSLLGGEANGHRALLAEPIKAVLIGIAVTTIAQAAASARWRQVVSFALAGACLLVGGLASLRHFREGMWRNSSALEVQEPGMLAQARRVVRDLRCCDVRTASLSYVLELVAGSRAPVWTPAEWLPRNDSLRPLSVQASTDVAPMAGLPKSLGTMVQFEEIRSANGVPLGWGYKTDGGRMGDEQVARSWKSGDRISGSFLAPAPGRILFSSPGYRLEVEGAVDSASFEDQGSVLVVPGLVTLTFLPRTKGQPPPASVGWHYLSADAGELCRPHALRPRDLFRIPVNGWLKSHRDENGTLVPRAVVPTIFEIGWVPENIPSVVSTVYQAFPHFPAGATSFVISTVPYAPLRIRVGGREVSFTAAEFHQVDLQTGEDGSMMVEVEMQGPSGRCCTALAIETKDGRLEVPPYGWFSPPRAPIRVLKPTRTLEPSEVLGASDLRVVNGVGAFKRASNLGDYPDYRGSSYAQWCYRKDQVPMVTWMTDPLPSAPVAIAFAASLSELPGRAELSLDGLPAVTFDLGDSFDRRTWVGQRARLDFVRRQIVSGNSGFFVLTVPPQWLNAGTPLEVSVKIVEGDPNSWFMLNGRRDTVEHEKLSSRSLRAMLGPIH
jgi:hypothetical protein